MENKRGEIKVAAVLLVRAGKAPEAACRPGGEAVVAVAAGAGVVSRPRGGEGETAAKQFILKAKTAKVRFMVNATFIPAVPVLSAYVVDPVAAAPSEAVVEKEVAVSPATVGTVGVGAVPAAHVRGEAKVA